MKNLILILLAICTYSIGAQQLAPFSLGLEALQIPNGGGLQSYAVGTSEGKWLVLGGRLDGLHRRQPFATFDVAGHNNQIIVIDPETQQQWSAPLSALPVPLREQLSATNPEFYQDGDVLYVIGGYGYSATAADHVTYDKLTAVDVPRVIDAVVNGTPYDSFFRQIAAPQFTVSGGRLLKIFDTYYLVGGQKFMGRYNPMGPDHGPGFVQEYTNQIRKFRLHDNGANFTVEFQPSWTDSVNLHRRDYNVIPQIMPNGQEGATAFSGVFQTTVDLPYLNCVNIDSSGYAVNQSFTQYYNHYHCATLPLYSAAAQEMHSVFFGGIAQFYDNQGVLVQDNNVPFVKTIARVTRRPDGQMAEYKMPVEMPDLLGAGAEFIPMEGLPSYPNGVFKLDELPDSSMIGFIYGGISSSAPNIFWINTGTESVASPVIYKVFLTKNKVNAVADHLNPQSVGALHMQVFPNPNNGVFSVKFNLPKPGNVWLSISDTQGKIVEREQYKAGYAGEHIMTRQLQKIKAGAQYFVTLETESERATVLTIVEE